MKVLLTTLNAKYIHINLAIRLLYQLNKDHSGLDWKEFTIKENKDEIARYCSEYEVVAFSCYIWNIAHTIQVARAIKAINSGTKILLGGPEVSYDWMEIISNEDIDFIITGEGELPFASFLSQYPNVENVPNLVQKLNGNILYNPNNEIFDVKLYQNIEPYFDDSVEEIKSKVAYIETSRGCPYKCEFCLASLDNKVRYLPNDHIKSTLLYLMEHGKVIKFLDRTFNMKRDFTIDIFEFILDNYKPNNVFQFEITADILHPDIIKFIQDKVPKGLFRFEIGIQTVNQKANLEVSRKQNFDKTVQIIKSIEQKVELHLDLIVGLAYDYYEDIKYSFESVFKLFAPELQLGFLKFLKGTPVRDKSEQHGFVFDPNPPYQIIRSNYLNELELQDIVLVENALEIYWNKPRAIHTLKYIANHLSIFDFLLGLGKYFVNRNPFHQYILNDVYDNLKGYINQDHNTNAILMELTSIDYYLQHKTKPKPFNNNELSKKEVNALVQTNKLNHHKFRYIMLPISFDFEVFKKENRIQEQESILVIEYNGIEYPNNIFQLQLPKLEIV